MGNNRTTQLRLLFLAVCLAARSTKQALASSAAGQETLVGVVGRDFVMIGADSSVSQSIAVTASNLDKIAILVEPFPPEDDRTRLVPNHNNWQQTIVAAAAGNSADADRLIGFLSAHCAIQEFEEGVGCDVDYIHLASSVEDDTENQTQQQQHHQRRQPFKASSAGLSVAAVAHLARTQISSALRSPQRMSVCLLVAGMVPFYPTTTATTSKEKIGCESNGTRTPADADHSFSKRLQLQVKMGVAVAQQKGFNIQTSERETPSKAFPANDDPDPDANPFSPENVATLQPQLFWLDEYGSMQKLQYGAHGMGANFCLSILDQGYNTNLTREQAADLIRECFDQLRTRFVINSPQPPCIKCVDAQGCRLIR